MDNHKQESAEMKVQVLRVDGQTETLTLDGEWTVAEGQYLNRLTKNGFDHFFTKEGTYDGWGSAIAGEGIPAAKAVEILETIEAKRDIKE